VSAEPGFRPCAQRTADGRLAFGSRGAPYHFGSRVRPSQDRDPRVFAAMRLADWEERRTRRPSVVARAMAPLIHG